MISSLLTVLFSLSANAGVCHELPSEYRCQIVESAKTELDLRAALDVYLAADSSLLRLRKVVVVTDGAAQLVLKMGSGISDRIQGAAGSRVDLYADGGTDSQLSDWQLSSSQSLETAEIYVIYQQI